MNKNLKAFLELLDGPKPTRGPINMEERAFGVPTSEPLWLNLALAPFRGVIIVAMLFLSNLVCFTGAVIAVVTFPLWLSAIFYHLVIESLARGK